MLYCLKSSNIGIERYNNAAAVCKWEERTKIKSFINIMNAESILESMLFISGEAMSFKRLSKYTSMEIPDLENAAMELARKYNEENRGMRILIKDKEVQMVTSGENSKYVESYMKADIEGELSRAALEVLSVVAYRGPISRSKIEEIRGVNCSFTLRHLLIRGLVERADNPNDARAYLYGISFDFLKKLGIEKVENLPRFQELKNKKILEERFVGNAEVKEESVFVRKEVPESAAKKENPGETHRVTEKKDIPENIESEQNAASLEIMAPDQSVGRIQGQGGDRAQGQKNNIQQ